MFKTVRIRYLLIAFFALCGLLVLTRGYAYIITNTVHVVSTSPQIITSSNLVTTDVTVPSGCIITPLGGQYFTVLGATLNFWITVQNTGDREDTFSLQVEDESFWEIIYPEEIGVLRSGESAGFVMQVIVPEKIKNDKINSIMLTAISTNDSTKGATVLYDVAVARRRK